MYMNVLFIKMVHVMFQETASRFCENDWFSHFMLTTLTPRVLKVEKFRKSRNLECNL